MPWTYFINDGEEIFGMFYKKELRKANKNNLELNNEKKKKNRDTLYVKRKDYDNSFNSCIDKKDSINE